MKTRIIKLKPVQAKDEKAIFTGKIALEKLREIWDDEERTYTDDELIRIRDWMYSMAESIIRTSRKERTISTVIPLNELSNEATQSNTLHPGEYRRAS